MSFTEIAPDFLLPDEVWEQVKPAIPPEPPKPKGERPHMDDRLCLDKGYADKDVREIVAAWGYVGQIPPRDEREQLDFVHLLKP